ncbi:hypothetical protein GCM10020001_019920 [Nonomuraea salmonea]
MPRHERVVQDRVGVAQVARQRHDAGLPGQQRAGVGEHDRVVVHVDDAGAVDVPPGHLVHVVLGGQPGADVDELPHARLGDRADRAAQEGAVGAGDLPGVVAHPAAELDHLLGGHPVGGEVVAAAEVVVVHAGDARHGGIDAGWYAVRLGHR